MIKIESLRKHFTLHLRDGIVLDVLDGFDLEVGAGECVALQGPSGAGKSTLLRAIYGNYRASGGRILIRHDGVLVDMATASPRTIMAVRRSIGYVSQFLRVVPRVATLDIIAEPLLARGVAPDEASKRAGALLARLRIAPRLWHLPPGTFSGGEQQRVNIARIFVADYPILLLDEPTASLDEANRNIVMALIDEARRRGAAILSIMHDPATRSAVATRIVPMQPIGNAA